MNAWKQTTIAPDGTHHLLGGAPLYESRWRSVGKFHAPGLAPAVGADGALHIGIDGRPAYARRFVRTFGFYEGLAAVKGEDGWSHVQPDGTDAYAARWSWCGNVQGGRVPVRDGAGRYRHIDPSGRQVGAVWRYAGDFRDGIAVVMREDGRSTHVHGDGCVLHDRWFLDLDVFHKGYARARDEAGWTHVDVTGRPAYAARYAMVEPFYNGQARVERFDGALQVIDDRGQIRVVLREALDRRMDGGRARKLLLVGLPGAGKTSVGDLLAKRLDVPVHRLDDLRRALADGTVAGDYLARAAFLRACRAPGDAILEFSAAGYHRVAVRQAFRETGDAVLTVWIDTPSDIRAARLATRDTTVPLPDWGIPAGAFDANMEAKLRADFETGFWQPSEGWQAIRVDGTRPTEEVADSVASAWRSLGGNP